MSSRGRFLRRSIFCLLLLQVPLFAVEHPGVIPKDANCSSCHADKLRGKSVHSALATTCTVCHLASTMGDMTMVNLLMPKEKICFACHEKSAEERQHPTKAQVECVDCHDAHSSARRMLLREGAPVLP